MLFQITIAIDNSPMWLYRSGQKKVVLISLIA